MQGIREFRGNDRRHEADERVDRTVTKLAAELRSSVAGFKVTAFDGTRVLRAE
jgi:hypothetical protein